MPKIDTSEWKKFVIGDLFDIHPTKAYKETNNTLFDEDGQNPVVVNSSYNNGIGGFTNKETTEKGGIITFSDTTTPESIFYQPNDFVGYPHVQGMYPIKYKDKWNEKTLKFFISVFRAKALSLNFDYVNKFNREYVSKMVLKLPAIDEEPDFKVMEDYIEDISSICETNFNHLFYIKDIEEKMIDTSEWEEFHLYDLFKIDSGSKLDKVYMKTDKPQINFVGRSGINKGITTKINKIADIEPYEAGNLTLALGGAYLGSCFVQNEPFYTSQNVNVLIPLTDMEVGSKLFIATVIFVESQLHYRAFIKELNKHVKTDFVIKLPVSSKGIPNWKYMNEYMDDLLKKQKDNVKILKAGV